MDDDEDDKWKGEGQRPQVGGRWAPGRVVPVPGSSPGKRDGRDGKRCRPTRGASQGVPVPGTSPFHPSTKCAFPYPRGDDEKARRAIDCGGAGRVFAFDDLGD
jgi:hypothetical protein